MKRVCCMTVLAVALWLASACGQKGVKTTLKDVAEKVSAGREQIPTICVYTLGKVSGDLREEMMDSLRRHYPKCRYAGRLDLPASAITQKRHDHVRYRADVLNRWLTKYKTDTTMVIGLTQADIGLDNFRNRAQSGIMGMASGYNTGVAVFSSYRPNNRSELFAVMIHELGHAQGLHHCTDEWCLMQNAKGGNPFRRTRVFCSRCKAYMQERHWKL